VRVRSPCGIFFVVVCMGSWLWCAFVVVVFVVLVGGDLFVHSSLLVGTCLFIRVCGEFGLLGSVLRCVFCVCVLCFCGLLVLVCDDVGCCFVCIFVV